MPILTVDEIDCDQSMLNAALRKKVTCSKCSGILIQPHMCEACRLMFCLQCATNGRCPFCQIRKVNQPSEQELKCLYDLRLHCPNKDCTKSGKYKFILMHLKTCGVEKVNRSFMKYGNPANAKKHDLIKILEQDSEKESQIILSMIKQINGFFTEMKKEEPIINSIESRIIQIASVVAAIDEKLK